jgi:hypothetical protein
MIRNALAATLIVYALLVGFVLKECRFLASVHRLVFEQYGVRLLLFSLILAVNIFAAIYSLLRRLSLKDTGDKLSHLEKQLRGRTTISEELTERILQRK